MEVSFSATPPRNRWGGFFIHVASHSRGVETHGVWPRTGCDFGLPFGLVPPTATSPPSAGAAPNPRDTPAMRQYAAFKAKHPDCLLLFRIGDFYELFDDDAVRASRLLGLTLTQRTAGVPMAGLPYHQLETYLKRLVAQGVRVAVAEQVQDAADAKGLVERAVTKVLTPGTLVDESLLSEDRACTVAAVCFPVADQPETLACIAAVEVSTGAFALACVHADQLADELARRGVSEVLYPETADGNPPARLARPTMALGVPLTALPHWHFRQHEAREALCLQYGVTTLGGFDLAEDDPLIPAAGAIVRYLQSTQNPSGLAGQANGQTGAARLVHLRAPRREQPGETLILDAASLRALEIDRTLRTASSPLDSSAASSLLGVFTNAAGRSLCRTALGRRNLREWLVRPPAVLAACLSRQAAVACMVEDRRMAAELGEALGGVQDVARIAARLALGRATPRDLVALGTSLLRLRAVAELISTTAAMAHWHRGLIEIASTLAPIAEEIGRMCKEDAPAHLREGGLIRDGVDEQLDVARGLQNSAATWLAAYQAELSGKYSLPSLKVGFNKVFGYFIELPKAQSIRAPAEFSRKQTLTTGERYTTPELKEYEQKVVSAESTALLREQTLFAGLCQMASGGIAAISTFAQIIAEIDVSLCFAEKAALCRWVKPTLTDSPRLAIVAGRHPVLDSLLGGQFVPNDVHLGLSGEAKARFALITGPNMAGKSTFIRQTALLVLLAHAGSYVPADETEVGICDRIFTRIGADDALHAGQSTFMVEMTETASILNHATAKSLVILDEIGRGTSTLDGLSLAWAIAEDLASSAVRQPRTLFATHYHELTQLAEELPGQVKNLHVAVREHGEQIVFLHRIIAGKAQGSYGLHVARLAGVPKPVINRASELLDTLSVQQAGTGEKLRAEHQRRIAAETMQHSADDGQMSLFTQYVAHPVLAEVKALDLDALDPAMAVEQLRRIKRLVDAP